jgi:hypothetical protein
MKSLTHPIALATFLLVAVFFSGCDDEDENVPTRLAGKQCAVLFRADALGAITNTNFTAQTGIVGTYRRATEDWVIIEKDDGEFWIPKSVILVVQQGGKIQVQ